VTTVRDIIKQVETLAGHPLTREEGVHHGSENCEVGSVAVAWMATGEALESAGAWGEGGADLFIGHESLYYPYDASVRDDNPDGWEGWRANARRREALERSGMTFLRLHTSMDEITILDDFAEVLGLGEPVVRDGNVRVHEIPECTYGELIEHVKARTGMDHVRVTFPDRLGRKVRRVGLPWGGLGLFVNVAFQQRVLAHGVDVLIAGESDNYGFRFAAEWDVPMIETSHETSENPGIRRFADVLAGAFPGLKVRFHENTRVWGWR
jgi:putative NIF3 family GTP cyclohydrolase 1 type 2